MSEGEDDGYLACIEDIKKCKLDIVEGEKANSVWIIVDDKYVLTIRKRFWPKTSNLKMEKVFGSVEEGGTVDVPLKWKFN